MGLWSKLTAEFIDIIEWIDSSSDTMVYRFERLGNEIKYGAKLIVREGQQAAFINEGRLADVFQPGTYTLETRNMPILSTLQGWKYGFHSPFKAEVYFISTRRFGDLKWGTKNPIMLRDREFGPVRLRAFGSYEMRVTDAPAFIREIVGTDGHFTTSEISRRLRNKIVAHFTDVLGESKIPVLDLAANQDELSAFLTERISDKFQAYGLTITELLIENISLPPAVEEALDKRSQMGVLGNLQQYTQFQMANALPEMAKSGGVAGALAGGGIGMGMGLAMAQQTRAMMSGSYGQPAVAIAASPPPAAIAAPPPLPAPVQFYAAINGQQAGPLDLNALQQKVGSGEIEEDTLVWKSGLPAWTPAGQVPELAPLFASAGPPPLPAALPPPPSGPPPLK